MGSNERITCGFSGGSGRHSSSRRPSRCSRPCSPGSSRRAARTRRHRSPASRSSSPARSSQRSSQGGVANGGGGGESADLFAAQQQWDNTRTAPGIVAPGAYSAAFASLQGLSATSGSWNEVTRVPYDADDPDYRDYYSNSSGGAGLVTGRITALAIGKDGVVYAGGADGGVWRSTTGRGSWQPIADSLPSLSSGDLQIDPTGALWYGTGEANTGGTSYVGSGVYRLANPASGTFSPSNRIGGTELESTTIYHLRFAGDIVYAATLRGVYSHSVSGPAATPWKLLFAPSPSYLPGGADSGAQNAGYQNIVNDLAVDPKNAKHLIAAAGWRGGAAYNGFYESKDAGTTWTKINPGGAINPKDIGYATFAFAADGSKLYVINESVKLYNQLTGTKAGNTLLDGIYVSNNGDPAGPWNKIAESTKLANSGSALKQSIGGKGYGPGVQAWYNQFLAVDPIERQSRLRGPRGGLRDPERAAQRGRRPARTGTSTSPAGGRTRCIRRTATSAARSRRTRTSTRSRSAPSAARRTSTSATTAVSTAGPPTGRSMRTATAPTGSPPTTGRWTRCSTTTSASAS